MIATTKGGVFVGNNREGKWEGKGIGIRMGDGDEA